MFSSGCYIFKLLNHLNGIKKKTPGFFSPLPTCVYNEPAVCSFFSLSLYLNTDTKSLLCLYIGTRIAQPISCHINDGKMSHSGQIQAGIWLVGRVVSHQATVPHWWKANRAMWQPFTLNTGTSLGGEEKNNQWLTWYLKMAENSVWL